MKDSVAGFHDTYGGFNKGISVFGCCGITVTAGMQVAIPSYIVWNKTTLRVEHFFYFGKNAFGDW